MKIICALQETWALGTALVEFNDFDIDAHCKYIIKREGPQHDKLYLSNDSLVWKYPYFMPTHHVMFKHPFS